MTGLPKQTSRKDLIKRLREIGFKGPFHGTGPHPDFMLRGSQTCGLPNPHDGDIRIVLLKRILANAGISTEEYLGK